MVFTVYDTHFKEYHGITIIVETLHWTLPRLHVQKHENTIVCFVRLISRFTEFFEGFLLINSAV